MDTRIKIGCTISATAEILTFAHEVGNETLHQVTIPHGQVMLVEKVNEHSVIASYLAKEVSCNSVRVLLENDFAWHKNPPGGV